MVKRPCRIFNWDPMRNFATRDAREIFIKFVRYLLVSNRPVFEANFIRNAGAKNKNQVKLNTSSRLHLWIRKITIAAPKYILSSGTSLSPIAVSHTQRNASCALCMSCCIIHSTLSFPSLSNSKALSRGFHKFCLPWQAYKDLRGSLIFLSYKDLKECRPAYRWHWY